MSKQYFSGWDGKTVMADVDANGNSLELHVNADGIIDMIGDKSLGGSGGSSVDIVVEELDEFPIDDTIPIAANTARFRFSNPEYDPSVDDNLSTGTNLYVTWSKVTEMEGNVWDGTCESDEWNYLFDYAFNDPENLVEVIAVGDLNVATTLEGTFAENESLISVASIRVPDNCYTLNYILGDCPNLVSVGGFTNSGHVTDCGSMFGGDSSLVTVPLFDTSGTTSTGWMFINCSSLVTVPAFDTSHTTDFEKMFQNCTSLETVPQLDLSSAECTGEMFDGCTSLVSVPDLDVSAAYDMYDMFKNCTSLVTSPNMVTTVCTNFNDMFEGCTALTTVGSFNTDNVERITCMFEGCTALTSLPNVEWPSVKQASFAFSGCINVESNILSTYSKLSANNPTSYRECFKDCGSNTVAGSEELAQIPAEWK